MENVILLAWMCIGLRSSQDLEIIVSRLYQLEILLFFFFLKFLLDTCPFLVPLTSLFQTSGDISSRFPSQSGFCLIRTLWRHTWYTVPEIHLWYKASAGLYSQQSSQLLSPHACFSRGRMPDLNHRPPAWQVDVLTTRPQWPRKFYY